jgi:hypothetical protein
MDVGCEWWNIRAESATAQWRPFDHARSGPAPSAEEGLLVWSVKGWWRFTCRLSSATSVRQRASSVCFALPPCGGSPSLKVLAKITHQRVLSIVTSFPGCASTRVSDALRQRQEELTAES